MSALKLIEGGGSTTPRRRAIVGEVGLAYREPCPYATRRPHLATTVEVKLPNGSTYHRIEPHDCEGGPSVLRPSAGSRTALDDFFDDEEVHLGI